MAVAVAAATPFAAAACLSLSGPIPEPQPIAEAPCRTVAAREIVSGVDWRIE